jgi:hypothetical protein
MSTQPPSERWQSVVTRAQSIRVERLFAEPLEAILAEIVEPAWPRPIELDVSQRYSLPRDDGSIDLRYPCTGSVERLHVDTVGRDGRSAQRHRSRAIGPPR